jgi:hypothetical protein
MSYRIRRIDPFWIAHPVVIVVILIGLILGLIGYTKGQTLLLAVGGGAMLIGVCVATRPAVSGVLATLGFFGGLFTFVLFPNPQVVDSSVAWRLVSTLFFAAMYMGLMDALVLVVAALYNFFSATAKLGGIELDIEESAEAGAAPEA